VIRAICRLTVLLLVLSLQTACRRGPGATPTAAPASPTPLAVVTAGAETANSTRPAATATKAADTPMPTATRPLPTSTATREPPSPTAAPSPSAAPPPSPTPPAEVVPVVSSLVVTPEQPPVLYAVIEGRLYRSADQGASWAEQGRDGLPDDAFLNAVAIDYRHPGTMYAVASGGIFRRQGNDAWTLVNTLRAQSLAVDLLNPDMLWAGVHRTTETNAVILKSEDAGRTWARADWGIEMWRAWVTDILIDPNDPNILWAVVRGDGWHGWPPGQVYRGGRAGQWERIDLKEFEPSLENVDSCHVAGVAYDPSANLLYAGCDLSYFNRGNLLLLRSPNADAADSSQVRWELATRFEPAESPATFGVARPLAVDAREPRSLFLSTSLYASAEPPRYRILVSHDDGQSWESLALGGLSRP
jgi:hypothetical protein